MRLFARLRDNVYHNSAIAWSIFVLLPVWLIIVFYSVLHLH